METEEAAACQIRLVLVDLGQGSNAPPDTVGRALLHLRKKRRRVGDIVALAACDRGLGLVDVRLGRPSRAARRFEDAATLFAACNLPADAAECHTRRIVLELEQADGGAEGVPLDVAVRALRKAARTMTLHPHPRGELMARLAIADLLLRLDRPGPAAREAGRAVALRHAGRVDDLDRAHALRHEARRRLQAAK